MLFSLGGKTQVNQAFGLAYGVTYGPYPVNFKDPYRQDLSLRYNFNYVRFMIKAGIGLRPNTFFGNQYTGLFQLGYSMPFNQAISFHFTSGICLSEADRIIVDDLKYEGTALNSSAGLFLRPFKNNKLLLGIEAPFLMNS